MWTRYGGGWGGAETQSAEQPVMTDKCFQFLTNPQKHAATAVLQCKAKTIVYSQLFVLLTNSVVPDIYSSACHVAQRATIHLQRVHGIPPPPPHPHLPRLL